MSGLGARPCGRAGKDKVVSAEALFQRCWSRHSAFPEVCGSRQFLGWASGRTRCGFGMKRSPPCHVPSIVYSMLLCVMAVRMVLQPPAVLLCFIHAQRSMLCSQ